MRSRISHVKPRTKSPTSGPRTANVMEKDRRLLVAIKKTGKTTGQNHHIAN
jgi:hypothetical protein